MVCLSISGPPSAPLNLTVSNVTNTSVVLSWLPPEDDGGRNISEIYYTVIAEGGHAVSIHCIHVKLIVYILYDMCTDF